MRYQGKITSWNDDQGFGFITKNGGVDQVFVHINACTCQSALKFYQKKKKNSIQVCHLNFYVIVFKS